MTLTRAAVRSRLVHHHEQHGRATQPVSIATFIAVPAGWMIILATLPSLPSRLSVSLNASRPVFPTETSVTPASA